MAHRDRRKLLREFAEKNVYDELVSDGLLKRGDKAHIEMTNKRMKLNGKKQDHDVYEKYREMMENLMNIEIKEKIIIEYSGD